MSVLLSTEGDNFYFHKAIGDTHSRCTQHYHDSLEIYYLKKGRCHYFIDNRSYEMKVGDIVLIPKGVIHKTNYENGALHTRYLINCTESFVPRTVISMIPSMPRLYRNPAIAEKAEALLERIGEEYERQDIFREEALTALTFELFFLLARNTEGRSAASVGTKFIEESVNFIQEHYMNDITLGEMAKMHSVSPEHLSRTFKKETGFGFSEYINLVRMQRAEYMLKNEPGRSVCEIAYAAGFNDSNYFSDKFKKAYGVSPSKFKKTKGET